MIDAASPIFRYQWARESGLILAVGSHGREAYRATNYALRIEFDNHFEVRGYEVEETKGLVGITE